MDSNREIGFWGELFIFVVMAFVGVAFLSWLGVFALWLSMR